MSTAKQSIKERILSDSLTLFAQRGLYGLSLAELSSELEISKPAILYHFAKPEDVFLALMDKWAESGAGFTNMYLQSYLGKKPKDIIVGVFNATLAWLDAEKEYAKFTLAVFLGAQSDKRVQAKLDTLFSGGRQRIQTLLQESGAVKSPLAAKLTALSLHSDIVGALIYEMLPSTEEKKKFRAQQLEKFKERLDNLFD